MITYENNQDNADGLERQEMLREEFHTAHEYGHYLWVNWWAVDPDPADPFFDTDDFGPVPKTVAASDLGWLVRTGCSLISLS